MGSELDRGREREVGTRGPLASRSREVVPAVDPRKQRLTGPSSARRSRRLAASAHGRLRDARA